MESRPLEAAQWVGSSVDGKNQYAGMKSEEAKRLKELEIEN